MRIRALIFASCFAAAAAQAQSLNPMAQPGAFAPSAHSTVDSMGSGAIPALPLDIMTNGIISYVTGGIGDEEVEQLKSVEHNYNVRLLVTAVGGEYISNIGLRLVDASGTELLSATNVGPYFYTALKSGSYVVELNSPRESAVRSVKITVPENGVFKKHFVFSE